MVLVFDKYELFSQHKETFSVRSDESFESLEREYIVDCYMQMRRIYWILERSKRKETRVIKSS